LTKLERVDDSIGEGSAEDELQVLEVEGDADELPSVIQVP
jgi:hypothetical protein